MSALQWHVSCADWSLYQPCGPADFMLILVFEGETTAVVKQNTSFAYESFIVVCSSSQLHFTQAIVFAEKNLENPLILPGIIVRTPCVAHIAITTDCKCHSLLLIGFNGVVDSSLQAVHRGIPSASRGDLHRYRGTQGRY